MKKALMVVAALLLAASVHAQTFEGFSNPVVVGGASYLTTAPEAPATRVRFLITANVPGIKPVASVPLYVGGAGIDIRTVDPTLGGVTGAGVSIPAVTYAFGGGQFVAQVGWAHDFSGADKTGGIYVGLGFGLTSPNKMAEKRAAKKAKAAAAAGK